MGCGLSSLPANGEAANVNAGHRCLRGTPNPNWEPMGNPKPTWGSTGDPKIELGPPKAQLGGTGPLLSPFSPQDEQPEPTPAATPK